MLRLAVITLLCAAALASPFIEVNSELNEDWALFKTVHNKYYTGNQEETIRRAIWEEHVDFIAKHNREYDMGLHTYTVGINEYADMTTEEFVAQMNGYTVSNKTSTGSLFLSPSHVQLPETVDWRKEGYVTAIKNQGQCGSCWAFSATGSLEGQTFKKTSKLVSLSEQNLVDCSKPEGNLGCQGGLMDSAFRYIKMNKGIDTEESYPYKAKNGRCHFKKADVGATDSGYMDIQKGSETELMSAVATVGPISVAMDASHKSFQLYKSGVYSERQCSSTRLDHGVLAVGYGTSDMGQAYWLVKNSWGTSWGMEGYFEMARNKNNECGIATQASYPTV